MRMPSHPLDRGFRRIVDRSGIRNPSEQGRLHRRHPCLQVGFFYTSCQSGSAGATPYIAKRHRLIEKLRSRHVQETGRKSWMTPCRKDMRASRKTGGEGFCPGTNHDRNPIHEEDVDAAVWQDPLCESNPRTNRLSPETQQVIGEGRRRPKLAVNGNCTALFLIAIHRCPEIAGVGLWIHSNAEFVPFSSIIRLISVLFVSVTCSLTASRRLILVVKIAGPVRADQYSELGLCESITGSSWITSNSEVTGTDQGPRRGIESRLLKGSMFRSLGP